MGDYSRSRNREYGKVPPGKLTRTVYYTSGNSQVTVTNSGGQDRGLKLMTDVVSDRVPFPDHGLTLSDLNMRQAGSYSGVHVLPGSFSILRTEYKADNHATYLQDAQADYHEAMPSVNWNYLETKALASVNPNTPLVDAPLFLYELREFPSLLKGLGDILARRISPGSGPDAYLAYQFGWAPLLSDLSTLLDLQGEMQRRIRKLQKANTGQRVGGLLSKRSVTGWTPEFQFNKVTLGSSKLTVSVRGDLEERCWFSGRFSLSQKDKEDLLRIYSDGGLDAVRHMLGLSGGVRAATIWNAVPWSFLIDYFVNIGDFLEVRSGSVDYTLSSVCLMCNQKQLLSSRVVDNTTTFSYTPLDKLYEKKLRTVKSIANPRFAYKPFLTETMKANLGALLTSRALRGA